MNQEYAVFHTDSIPKLYFKLSLPLVLSMTITLIYNLADTFFVAQTANTSLVAGVSLCAPVLTLIMALGNIFGQGGSSLISRLLGQQDASGIRHASSFCFYVTIFAGILLAGLMLLIRGSALRLLGADSSTLAYASEYYTVLAVGAPVIALSFIHSNILRSEGLSRESMLGTAGGTAVNIVLDPIMISVWGWGAKGAAIATVIGYLFTDLFLLLITLKRSRILSVRLTEIRIPGEHIRQIFGIGLSAAVVNIMQSICIILLNQSLLPYGTAYIAAMGIVQKVNMIAMLILVGLAFGGQPMFGYYYGSGDSRRLRRLLRFCMRFISLAAVLLTAFVFGFAPALIRIFMQDPSIVSIGTIMLRWQVITMVCVGFILLITILFQSFGKIAGSMFLALSRQGIVFIAVLLIASRTVGYQGILAAQAVSDLITIGIAGILYRVRILRLPVVQGDK